MKEKLIASGEFLFGKTVNEAMIRVGIYGSVILIGMLTKNPVLVAIGFAAMVASVGAVGIANVKEEAKARSKTASNSRMSA